MNVPTWIMLVLAGDPSIARYFSHDAKKRRRVWVRGHGTAMERISCSSRCRLNEATHLSFSLRLLGPAVPLDWDQQIRLINLLTKSQESPNHQSFGQSSQTVLALMCFFGIPLGISLGSRPTRRLKKGKVE